MNWSRIGAVTMVLLGAACLQAALGESLSATNCGSSTRYVPATCKHAFEVASGNSGANMSCTYSGSSGSCVPASGSSCGSSALSWGTAVPGQCQTEAFGSTPHYCLSNYGVTTLTLHQWGTRCSMASGSCYCETYQTGSGTSNVQVCDCTDGLY